MKITVFTPTYNRAYILPQLYASLARQSYEDFEWLIVDDGSTDNTKELVDKWILENKVCLRFFAQQNGGKHRAINLGARKAQGELFFIVDSDDFLTENALERIVAHYDAIKDDDIFAGVCGLRCYPDGKRIGGESDFHILECSPLEFRFTYKIDGDMAEVVRTEILRNYPFPEIDNEKFCAEAVVFNRIAQKYKLRYFYEKIYVCSYLPDGLTAKIIKIRMTSPMSSMICYAELTHFDIPFMQKVKAAINYWRFSFCSTKSLIKRIHEIGFIWLCMLPIGYIFHRIDKLRV